MTPADQQAGIFQPTITLTQHRQQPNTAHPLPFFASAATFSVHARAFLFIRVPSTAIFFRPRHRHVFDLSLHAFRFFITHSCLQGQIYLRLLVDSLLLQVDHYETDVIFTVIFF